MRRKATKNQKTSDREPESASPSMRMLARCEDCVKDYAPRGRGGSEISDLKVFYLPHEKLAADKSALICPMHKGEMKAAGLILSEDCLLGGSGFAMGLVGFKFSDAEIAAARDHQIWPKIGSKIELDPNVISKLSDQEILKMIKKFKSGISK